MRAPARLGIASAIAVVCACTESALPPLAPTPPAEIAAASVAPASAAPVVAAKAPPPVPTWTPAVRVATIEGAIHIMLVDAESVWLERGDGLARISKRDGSAEALRGPFENGSEGGLVEANGYVYRATSFIANAVSVMGLEGAKRAVANKTPNLVTIGEGNNRQTTGLWSYVVGYKAAGGAMLAIDGGLGLRTALTASSCGVFWVGGVTELAPKPEGWIVRATPGHPPKMIVRGEKGVTGLVAEGGDVFWTTLDPKADGPGVHGAVKRARCTDGTSRTTIAQAEDEPSDLSIDASHVYWRSGSHDVRRAPKDAKDAKAAQTVAKLPPKANNVRYDATHVYFLDGSSSTHAVMRFPKSGGVATPVLPDVDGYLLAGDHVYGFRKHTLVRAPKDGKGEVAVVIDRGVIGHDVSIDGDDVYFLERETLMKAKASRGGVREPRSTPPSTPAADAVPAACTGVDIDLARALASAECRVDPAESGKNEPAVLKVEVTPSKIETSVGKETTLAYSIDNDRDESARIALELRGDGRAPYAPEVSSNFAGPRDKKGRPAARGGYWPRGDYPCSFGEGAARMMHSPPHQRDWGLARGFVVLPPHGKAHGTVTWQPLGEKWLGRRTPDGGCFAEAVTEDLDAGDYHVDVSFRSVGSTRGVIVRATIRR